MNIGDKFGHWTVIELGHIIRYGKNQTTLKAVKCRCDCENHTEKIIAENTLKTGNSKSCGCNRGSALKKREKAKHPDRIQIYKTVYYPSSPSSYKSDCNKGYIKEHRLVAEQMLGRPLLPTEVVHHLDGNKLNNDPSNLQILTASEHSKLHHELRAGGTLCEDRCIDCGKLLSDRRIAAHRLRRCTECARINKRKVKNRPSKEELEKLVWSIPTTKLAKQFGITDSAINKWCKQLNIEKPGVGYWSKRKTD